MPFYRYQAREPKGGYLDGTIEAKDINDAQAKLFGRGLRPISVTPSEPIQAPAQASQAASPTAMAQDNPVPPRPAFRKTRWSSNRDLMLLFSQFASYLRAGINPAQAAHSLANNALRKDFQEALQAASTGAAEGGGLAAAFAQYPYLFPQHVVGIVRAGELGGFLPEACDAISAQAEGTRKFAMLFKVLAFGVVSLVLFVPIGIWLIRSTIDTWRIQDAAGGQASGFGTFFAALWHQLVWPVGPIAVASLGVLLALLMWSLSMPMIGRRHAFSRRIPVAGPRAWSEGLALFSWTLSHLFKSGMAPKTAVMAAACTIPNLAVRQEIEAIANQMGESTPLSQAFGQAKAIPDVYRSLILTGEMTGDLPGQLLVASSTSREQVEDVERDAKRRIGCWGCLLYLIGLLFLVWLVYRVFYGEIFKQMDSENAQISSTHRGAASV